VSLPHIQGLPQEADYGRGVVRIRDGEADYGLDLVRAGWARPVRHAHLKGDAAAYASELDKAQAAARAGRAGGWGACGW
jgi:endonuclease YncB( thermonuclease family)